MNEPSGSWTGQRTVGPMLLDDKGYWQSFGPAMAAGLQLEQLS